MSCETNNIKITVLNNQVIEVPSASGITKLDDKYYAIGDDSPYLFTLDSEFMVIEKSAIYPIDDLDYGTFHKKDKPDFETIEIIDNNEMVVFGSGSRSPKRDIFLRLLWNESPEFKTYNLTTFYNKLRDLEVLKDEDLNIEATAYHDKHLYLFNRGKNVIFNFVYSDLIDFLDDKSAFPIPLITEFNLPKISGIRYGFSGATAFNYKPYIFFTASGENTKNAYNDGVILGSIIGVIPINNNEVSSNFDFVTIPNAELPLKVESVSIDAQISERETNVILVTDSDGGESILLRCNLKW